MKFEHVAVVMGHTNLVQLSPVHPGVGVGGGGGGGGLCLFRFLTFDMNLLRSLPEALYAELSSWTPNFHVALGSGCPKCTAKAKSMGSCSWVLVLDLSLSLYPTAYSWVLSLCPYPCWSYIWVYTGVRIP